MTIYVDDFASSPASRVRSPIDGRLEYLSHMIADDRAELQAFARKLGVGDAYYQDAGPFYRLPLTEARKAVLLGAVQVTYQQLAAMVALRFMGFDMTPVETACDRRRFLASH